jgi:hypothetical protein
MFEKVKAWVMGNKLMAVAIGIVVFLVAMPKMRRKLFSTGRVRRRRAKVKTVIRGNRSRTIIRRPARQAVKSSGGTGNKKGYAAPGGGTIPFKYNKNGTIKQAQFVAGTLAAKRRMAALRKNR